MELLAAIEPDQIKSGAIVVLVLLGLSMFVVMRFIQKVVVKLVMIGVLVGAGVFVYAQRDDLDECQTRVLANPGVECTCEFAGYDVTVPGCAALLRRNDG